MAIILRIDVDRPYGREPLLRHVASRLSSDYWWPKIESLGYLRELSEMLGMLNQRRAQAYAFFRRCTRPSRAVIEQMNSGGHIFGLHLENSRSFETFQAEKAELERHLGRKVRAFSKHGSGGQRYGRTHFAPYEPEKYVDWASRASMSLFLGNLEDPTLPPASADGVRVYPSAFWLEPHWRNTRAFPLEWLLTEAKRRDVVMLVHPENVLASAEIKRDFERVIDAVETRIVE
jgi:hypothetical protein